MTPIALMSFAALLISAIALGGVLAIHERCGKVEASLRDWMDAITRRMKR